MQNTASVIGILTSFSTSIILGAEGLDLLANFAGFAGILLTLSLVLKNMVSARLEWVRSEEIIENNKSKKELLKNEQQQSESGHGGSVEPEQ